VTTREPILETRALTKEFATPRLLRARSRVIAVDEVSIGVDRGRTLGIVGESGSGKTTLGRMIVGLVPMTAGEVLLDGRDTRALGKRELNGRIQYVFQDPYSSLNPRRTVGAAIAVPLQRLVGLERAARATRVAQLMSHVGLRPELVDRYPHELSGGQRQRIGIARALAAAPEVIVLDEPVSSLDVSIQAQILALLRELQAELSLTYLFISHDLAVVESVCDDVVVMYRGKVVEEGERRRLFREPQHEYTQKLLAAVPGGHYRRRGARSSMTDRTGEAPESRASVGKSE
jgi:ABC-type oligopeptide transport system ATPase subunit